MDIAHVIFTLMLYPSGPEAERLQVTGVLRGQEATGQREVPITLIITLRITLSITLITLSNS